MPSLYMSQRGDMSRKRPIDRLICLMAWSISASVVNRPKLKRMELCANSSSRPRARNTYDGSKLADVHAEPDDTAKSFNAIRSEERRVGKEGELERVDGALKHSL